MKKLSEEEAEYESNKKLDEDPSDDGVDGDDQDESGEISFDDSSDEDLKI